MKLSVFRTLLSPFHVGYISTDDVHRHLLSDCEFCENRRSDSHAFIRGAIAISIRNSYFYFPICFIFRVGDISCFINYRLVR
jgi:hypothetical protein